MKKRKLKKTRRVGDCVPCKSCGLKPAFIRTKDKKYYLNCFNWTVCANSTLFCGTSKSALKKKWNKDNKKGK